MSGEKVAEAPPAGLWTGPDGHSRCAWSAGAPEYVNYHDDEWGRPVRDDDGLFERICLEAFQSGLSWLTILRKRTAFRSAFADFAIESVAAFGPDDVARLLTDASIVRNRAKIEAAVANARAVLRVRDTEGGLAALIWSFAPDPGLRPAPREPGDIPTTTPESSALARALRQRGFRFVGPTTAYALMQAAGLVNDHLAGCYARAAASR